MQAKRKLLISKGWMQGVVIVGLCGFLLLGILAYRTYTDEPPIPSKVLGSGGQLLFTGDDVIAGQEVFLKNGLMEYGSIFGHGAYLGPDSTADYLHRAARISDERYDGSSDSARQQTVADFKANRYDPSSGVLTYSPAQTDAFKTDHERRITYYRAPATACNSCSLKFNCTDSDEGRLLETRSGTWIESELRRFHRGISLALLVLATLILVAEIFRFAHPHDREALVGLLLPLGLAQLKLLPSLKFQRQT